MSRALKNEISKEKILKAAIHEFGNNNYETASTNRMCKNHDISKGLLFHYYKSKDEIFLVCTQKCIDEVINYLACYYEKGTGGWYANIDQYLRIRGEFFSQFPELGRIFGIITFHPPIHLKDEIAQQKKKLYELNKKILADIMEGLELKEELSREKAIILILEFADYLLIKDSGKLEDIKNFFEIKNKELMEIIQILFYGILK